MGAGGVLNVLEQTTRSSHATIAGIDFSWIRIPLKSDYRGSVYHVPEKNAIITRITTTDGAVGHAINGEGSADMHARILALLEGEFRAELLDEDPSQIERLWAKMWKRTRLHNWDRRVAVRAIAALDSALWDLKGKLAGLPLYELWGGARDRVPIVAIGGQYVDGADYGSEMETYRALGLAGCKFKVGGRSPAEDAARTRAARAAGGPDFILCVDANRGWSRDEALAFWRLTPDLNLRWFEEPCHWDDDRDDMALFRAMTGMPVAAGQSEYTVQGCRDLLVSRSIDVCNIDASWGGGPTAWLRVAKMAQCFGVEMAHHGEPLVGSHLLAAVENGTYVETHHPDRDPVFHRLVVGRGAIRDGDYVLPAGPGFGIEFDPEFERAYRQN